MNKKPQYEPAAGPKLQQPPYICIAKHYFLTLPVKGYGSRHHIHLVPTGSMAGGGLSLQGAARWGWGRQRLI